MGKSIVPSSGRRCGAYRIARSAYVFACRVCGALACAEHMQRSRLTILTYHRVLPAGRIGACLMPDLAVTPEALYRHGQVLRETYDVLPLGEAVDAWRHRSRRARPLAALTFDDGYGDNCLWAAPVLADLGLRATFFPIAGLVGSERLPWYDRLARSLEARLAGGPHASPADHPLHMLMPSTDPDQNDRQRIRAAIAIAKRMPPASRARLVEQVESQVSRMPSPAPEDLIMSPSQLRHLARAGHEIGSHGLAHEILPLLDEEAIRTEVEESRRRLELWIDRPVQSFCYPNGDVDARVAAAVAAAGYTCATTSRYGSNGRGQDPFLLRRWFIHEQRMAGTGSRSSALLLRATLCGLTHPADSIRSLAATRP